MLVTGLGTKSYSNRVRTRSYFRVNSLLQKLNLNIFIKELNTAVLPDCAGGDYCGWKKTSSLIEV